MAFARRIDTAWVDILLDCMQEAERRDGDIKPASLSPQAQVVLDLTRTGRLFETFASSADAALSFSGYLPTWIGNFTLSPNLKQRARGMLHEG